MSHKDIIMLTIVREIYRIRTIDIKHGIISGMRNVPITTEGGLMKNCHIPRIAHQIMFTLLMGKNIGVQIHATDGIWQKQPAETIQNIDQERYLINIIIGSILIGRIGMTIIRMMPMMLRSVHCIDIKKNNSKRQAIDHMLSANICLENERWTWRKLTLDNIGFLVSD